MEKLYRWPGFNADKDAEIITAGTHFYCLTHLMARPVSERSPDPRYCQGCYEFLKNEAALLGNRARPGWLPKDTATPDLNHAVTLQANKQAVTKLIQGEILPLACDKTTINGKHHGGRPRKTSDYSKRTEYRRVKEAAQGILLFT